MLRDSQECYRDHKSIVESLRLEIDLFFVSPTHSWKVSFVRRDFLPVPVLEESVPGCSASVLLSDPQNFFPSKTPYGCDLFHLRVSPICT